MRGLCARAVLVVALTICLGQAANYLLASGLLFQMVRPRLELLEAHALEASLFDAHPLRPASAILIGDDRFLDEVAPMFACRQWLVRLRIPRPQFADVAIAAFYIRDSQPEWVVIQNLPHFWSDYRARWRKQNPRLWKHFVKPADGLLPLDSVREVFDTVHRWAAAKPPSSVIHRRPKDFFNVAFSVPGWMQERAYQRLVESITPHVQSGVVAWVFDPGDIPADAPEATRAALIERFGSGREDPELGLLLSQSQLPRIDPCQEAS